MDKGSCIPGKKLIFQMAELVSDIIWYLEMFLLTAYIYIYN